MREIVVVQWCDGEHVELTRANHSHQLAVGSAKPVQLDLCDECDQAMVELAELLSKGRRDDAPLPAITARGTRRMRQDNPNATSRPCPLCGKRSTSETGLRQHFQKYHFPETGESLVDYDERVGAA